MLDILNIKRTVSGRGPISPVQLKNSIPTINHEGSLNNNRHSPLKKKKGNLMRSKKIPCEFTDRDYN